MPWRPAVDLAPWIKGLAQSGKDGATIVSGVVSSIQGITELAETEPWAASAVKVAGFAERVTPFLGLVANASSLAARANKLASDSSDTGVLVSLIGDSIATIGSVIEVIPTPLTEGVGGLISSFGGGVAAAGELLSGFIKDGRAQDRRGALLGSISLPDSLRQQLLNAQGSQVADLTERLGLNAEQIQLLANQYPRLLEVPTLDGAAGLVKNAGLGSVETTNALLSIGEGLDSRKDDGVFNAVLTRMQLLAGSTPPPGNLQQWIDALKRERNSPQVQASSIPNFQQGFDHLIGELESLQRNRAPSRPVPRPGRGPVPSAE